MPTELLAAGECIVRPDPRLGSIDNPLKGWCPYTNAEPITQPYSMVFLYVSWRELEPREGEYRFAEWEKRAWEVPSAQGKHIVFRVYLDYPAMSSGVPEWLIAKGVKMTSYSDYQEKAGRDSVSLSPDYEHPALIAGLERLIFALGARYNHHPRVAFLQLGLLGFWGEWHNYPRNELFASNRVQQHIVEAYHTAFPDKKLMSRYAGYYVDKQPWIGFHDDMFPEDTGMEEDWHFLSRLRKAGRLGNWHQSVIGGEMVPGGADRWIGPGFERTRKMIEAAHFSWVGPYCPAIRSDSSAEYNARCQTLVRQMGYQFQWTEIRHPARVRRGDGLPITMIGTNTGVAPFYYDWPMHLALFDEQRRIVAAVPLSADIRTWRPGRFQLHAVPRVPVKPGVYTLGIGIIDPWTKQPGIAFANNLPVHKGWTLLSRVTVHV